MKNHEFFLQIFQNFYNIHKIRILDLWSGVMNHKPALAQTRNFRLHYCRRQCQSSFSLLNVESYRCG